MGFMDRLKSFFGSAKGKAGDVAEKAGDVASDVAEKTGDVAGAAAEKAKDVVEAAVEKAKDVVEDVKDRFDGDDAEGNGGEESASGES